MSEDPSLTPLPKKRAEESKRRTRKTVLGKSKRQRFTEAMAVPFPSIPSQKELLSPIKTIKEAIKQTPEILVPGITSKIEQVRIGRGLKEIGQRLEKGYKEAKQELIKKDRQRQEMAKDIVDINIQSIPAFTPKKVTVKGGFKLRKGGFKLREPIDYSELPAIPTHTPIIIRTGKGKHKEEKRGLPTLTFYGLTALFIGYPLYWLWRKSQGIVGAEPTIKIPNTPPPTTPGVFEPGSGFIPAPVPGGLTTPTPTPDQIVNNTVAITGGGTIVLTQPPPPAPTPSSPPPSNNAILDSWPYPLTDLGPYTKAAADLVIVTLVNHLYTGNSEFETPIGSGYWYIRVGSLPVPVGTSTFTGQGSRFSGGRG